MISAWKSDDNSEYRMLVSVPDFKFSLSGITLPVLAGFNDDSEESVICLLYIYRGFSKFVGELLHDMGAMSCSHLTYEQTSKLDQVSKLFVEYTKTIGTKKYFPDVNERGYFSLRPTECIPYSQYVYEAVEDKLFDIRVFLTKHGLEEESTSAKEIVPFEIWE